MTQVVSLCSVVSEPSALLCQPAVVLRRQLSGQLQQLQQRRQPSALLPLPAQQLYRLLARSVPGCRRSLAPARPYWQGPAARPGMRLRPAQPSCAAAPATGEGKLVRKLLTQQPPGHALRIARNLIPRCAGSAHTISSRWRTPGPFPGLPPLRHAPAQAPGARPRPSRCPSRERAGPVNPDVG
jgi:hypothetical protein